jgi:hypothetical protein
MKRKITIVGAIALSCMSAFSQDLSSALILDQHDLNLRVGMFRSDISFGDTIPFTVTLEGRERIGLFDMETAWLHFQLKKYEEGRYITVEEQGWHKTIGGTFQYYITRSGMHQLLRLKQNKIELKQGDVLTRQFELDDLMGEFTYPGKYMLCTTYEWQIKDSVQFTINLAYDDVIPRLLEYMRNSNTRHGRISPYKVFVYLTGYAPGNKVILPEEESMLVPQLSNWWKANKGVVLKVEETLNRGEYRDLNYNKRMTAILKAMRSDEHSKRLAATQELQRITNVVLVPPSAQDSAELIRKNAEMVTQWWNRNKELVEWVNRVVIENRIEP